MADIVCTRTDRRWQELVRVKYMKRPSMTRLLAMTNVSPAAMARLAPACVGGIWHYNQLHNGRRINNGCYQLPRKVEEDVLKEGHIVIISWLDFEVSLPQWRAKTMTTFHKINTINKTQMQTITYVQYLKFIFTTQTCETLKLWTLYQA